MKPRLLCSDRRGFYIVEVIDKTVYRGHNYGEYFIISLKKVPSPKRVSIFIGKYPVYPFRLAYTPLILDIEFVSISISSQTKCLVPLHFSFHTIKVYIG